MMGRTDPAHARHGPAGTPVSSWCSCVCTSWGSQGMVRWGVCITDCCGWSCPPGQLSWLPRPILVLHCPPICGSKLLGPLPTQSVPAALNWGDAGAPQARSGGLSSKRVTGSLVPFFPLASLPARAGQGRGRVPCRTAPVCSLVPALDEADGPSHPDAPPGTLPRSAGEEPCPRSSSSPSGLGSWQGA